MLHDVSRHRELIVRANKLRDALTSFAAKLMALAA
jgi:hypothetical protein